MIRFVKQEDGLLDEVQRTANLDWDRLKAEIADWLGDSRRKIEEYVPIEPLEDDEQDNIQESGENSDWDGIWDEPTADIDDMAEMLLSGEITVDLDE